MNDTSDLDANKPTEVDISKLVDSYYYLFFTKMAAWKLTICHYH